MNSLSILERLLAFPTVSHQSNLDLIDWVERLFSGTDANVTRIGSECGTKAGLFVRIGPEVDGGVCLSAHSDVVPVEGQDWNKPPFEMTQDGNRVYGRGATDMKGFLASALSTALQASQMDLRKPLLLSISYDEEVGCLGIQEMLPKLRPLIGKPQLVVVGEPTSMRPAIGHKGKIVLRVTCTGQSGHSALAPSFTNAIHVAAEFIREIRSLQEVLAVGSLDTSYEVPYSTIHIGLIKGGHALNIVPEDTVLQMEVRHLPNARPSDIVRQLRVAADHACLAVGGTAQVHIEEINSYPAFEIPFDHPSLVNVTSLFHGREPCKVAFGTEAGFFAEIGLPTIVIGPGDMHRDGHRADEGLDLSDLSRCDDFLSDLTALLH